MYFLIKWLCVAIVRSFFKEVAIVHKEWIPLYGPVRQLVMLVSDVPYCGEIARQVSLHIFGNGSINMIRFPYSSKLHCVLGRSFFRLSSLETTTISSSMHV